MRNYILFSFVVWVLVGIYFYFRQRKRVKNNSKEDSIAVGVSCGFGWACVFCFCAMMSLGATERDSVKFWVYSHSFPLFPNEQRENSDKNFILTQHVTQDYHKSSYDTEKYLSFIIEKGGVEINVNLEPYRIQLVRNSGLKVARLEVYSEYRTDWYGRFMHGENFSFPDSVPIWKYDKKLHKLMFVGGYSIVTR